VIALGEIPGLELLQKALGPEVAAFRSDPTVVEILVRQWGISIDRLGVGLVETGIVPRHGSIELVLRTIRSMTGGVVTEAEPLVECEMPEGGERFSGCLSPTGSFFTIRCHRAAAKRLEEYASDGGTGKACVRALCAAIEGGKNVAIVGPTGSGKTTLLRATVGYAAEVRPNQHFLVIEDTPEIAVGFHPPHRTIMVTTPALPMRALSRAAMRHRPNVLVYGEIRGGEALDVRNYAISGHQLYFTFHSYSAYGALNRFQAMVAEAVLTVDPERTVEAINVIATAARRLVKTVNDETGEASLEDRFFIKELVSVDGFVGNRWQLTSLLEDNRE
jgi:Flp pilus assembly CpaF family ATPase